MLKHLIIIIWFVLLSGSAFAESLCVFEVDCLNVEYMMITKGPMSVNPKDPNDHRRKMMYCGYIFLKDYAYKERTDVFRTCDKDKVSMMSGGRLIEKYPASGIPIGKGVISFFRDTEEEVRSLLNIICKDKIIPGIYR